jgi:hypothetical protein
VKNATEYAKKFKKFRRKLPSIDVATVEQGVIGEVIYAHLLWNAAAKQASIAYKKLIDASVDLNDLRMNHIFETVDFIGVNYPQANERAKRMKAVLNSIYRREHGMHVESLEGAGKRDVRDYFETLEGITPFVTNRVISICYGVAAIPVDDRTLSVMVANELLHDTASVTDAASWLGRQVKADEVCGIHVCLHAWVELQPTPKPVKSKAAKKKSVAKKKVTKKKVAKKPATKKKITKKSVTKKKVSKKPATKKKTTKKKVAKKKGSKKK